MLGHPVDVVNTADTPHHKVPEEDEPEREKQVHHPRSSSVLPAMALALTALFPVVTTRFFGDAFGVPAADDDADGVLAVDACVLVGRGRRLKIISFIAHSAVGILKKQLAFRL